MLKYSFILLFLTSSCASKYPKKVKGSLSYKIIRSILMDNHWELNNCLSFYHKTTGDLKTYKLPIIFTIEKTGEISKVKINKNKKKINIPRKIQDCFFKKIYSIKFPESDNSIEINQPFYLGKKL